MKNNAVYQRLGITPVVNAGGTHTTHGGSMMRSEVINAMAIASQSFVDLAELKISTGKYVAKVTGAEGGMITCGAASGIVLATAACMTGTNESYIRKLPNTEGMKNEILMQFNHYGVYGNVHRFAGANVTFAGNVSGCTSDELEGSITKQTAGISYTYAHGYPLPSLSLEEVVTLAHRNGVPVMVDAAAMLPPKENLTKFVELGADLVIFSGGKFIGGPQSTGLLFGNKNLVESALLNSGPNPSIGRPQKVGREELVGMVTALELYVESDENEIIDRMTRQAELVCSKIGGIQGVNVAVKMDLQKYFVPTCVIGFQSNGSEKATSVADLMHEGNPRVYVAKSDTEIAINPFNLRTGEENIVADRLLDVLQSIDN